MNFCYVFPKNIFEKTKEFLALFVHRFIRVHENTEDIVSFLKYSK